jgi:hypothetical protein
MKRVLILSVLTLGITTLAHAQATRTWVSGVGDDANPCSRTAPCKTFAGAISKTASPGIINCLDPGGFGAVTITKSITIDCTGTLGSVLSSGVQGVIVNGLTNSAVVLRNIDINGAGTTLGTNGISITQAGSVIVDHVTIGNYSGNGVQTVNTSNVINVFISNSMIANISTRGVFLNNTSTGTNRLFVTDSQIWNNGSVGIDVGGANNILFVKNTDLSRNVNVGLQVQQGTSSANVESSMLSSNGTGVVAGLAGATVVRLSRCTITGNTTNGLSGSGTTKCFSNNVIDGNVGSNVCSSPDNLQH